MTMNCNMPQQPSFASLCQLRHSSREYDPSPISRQEIGRILEAVRLAPSACNRQPWRFYVVTDPDKRRQMLSKSRPGFMQAPVLIAAVGLHAEAWHRPADGKDHTDVDVAIAVEHLCLSAADLGFDSCWVCSFDTAAVSQALGLGAGEEPIALIPIGRAQTPAPEKIRKTLEDIAVYVD